MPVPLPRIRAVTLVLAFVAGFLLLGASPTASPDHPVRFISVVELKELLDRNEPAVIIDVRTRAEYDTLHIEGARSLPLRETRQRAKEVPRTGLVVLY